MPQVWTIRETLDWCQGYLERHGDPNPRLSAQWLLSHATGYSRIEVYTHFDQPLSIEERDLLREAVRRRGAGEPLQYITGEAPFRFLTVKVAPGVLIPRPETEMLVELALNQVDQCMAGSSADEMTVVDCCTGSGCIACAMATERPGIQVIATDISPEALAVARSNVAALDIEDAVTCLECDMMAGVGDACAQVVVSNPPYIPEDVMMQLPDEVASHEPRLALAGGADGLDLFRVLLEQGQRVLMPGGRLACELHEDCLDDAAGLARLAGYEDVRIEADLTGRPRFLLGRWGQAPEVEAQDEAQDEVEDEA